MKQLPRFIILIGDLKLWGGRNWRDQRGKMLENIVTEERNILNNGSPTHISGTSVDFTIASSNVAPDLQCTVLPSVLSSDPHPIVLTRTTADTSKNQSDERCHFKKCNWNRYRKDSQWKKQARISECG